MGLIERHGVVFSEPMELLHALISGEWLPTPLPQGPIGPALYTNRVIFGREALEIRRSGEFALRRHVRDQGISSFDQARVV